jgi:hypothetical protein
MENRDVIRVLELTKLDVHELQQELGETVRFDSEPLTADRAGEPATLIAVVVLSALAIKGISLWLMKRRTKGEVEFSFELQRKDGSVERRIARVVFSSSAPPPASIIEQVGKALHVEESIINEAKNLVTE